MTYEAPPDNDHKVVRLHGTTESYEFEIIVMPYMRWSALQCDKP